MAEEKKWSYEELEEFLKKLDVAMTWARTDEGSYVKAFEGLYSKDFRGYKWVNSDMNPFVVRGIDQTMRIALGAEMSGHGGWKYPMLDYWIDEEQGVVAYEWLMESPWPVKNPENYYRDGDFYRATGTGYTIHFYGGDMLTMEQEDCCPATPLQFSHELGLATGQMNQALEDQFYMRRSKEKQSFIAWQEHLEDVAEEYGNV